MFLWLTTTESWSTLQIDKPWFGLCVTLTQELKRISRHASATGENSHPARIDIGIVKRNVEEMFSDKKLTYSTIRLRIMEDRADITWD